MQTKCFTCSNAWRSEKLKNIHLKGSNIIAAGGKKRKEGLGIFMILEITMAFQKYQSNGRYAFRFGITSPGG